MSDNDRLRALIKRWLDANDETCAARLLQDVHPVDVAEIVERLPPEDQLVVRRLIREGPPSAPAPTPHVGRGGPTLGTSRDCRAPVSRSL